MLARALQSHKSKLTSAPAPSANCSPPDRASPAGRTHPRRPAPPRAPAPSRRGSASWPAAPAPCARPAPAGLPSPPPKLCGPISASPGLRGPRHRPSARDAGAAPARRRRRRAPHPGRQVRGAPIGALAGVAPGLALDLGLAGHRVGADHQFGGLEPLQLVAQPRRLLEFEVRGRGPHALLDVGDRGLEVVADEVLGPAMPVSTVTWSAS